MLYWLNKESEKNNLIILNKNAILLSSCDEEHYERVDSQLKNKANPIELLGKDNISLIPFIQIQGITSRSTEPDIDIKYKADKEIEDKSIEFIDVEAKQKCLSVIEKLLGDNLQKNEHQQSAFSASLSPFLSLLIASIASYFFYPIFLKTTVVIGGIWSLGSIFKLVERFREPPKITRWTEKGRYMKKTWGVMKGAYSLVIIAAIIAGLYFKMAAFIGPSSLYNAIHEDDLTATDVSDFLGRGADINYKGDDGTTPLFSAINFGEEKLAIAIVENGANLSNSYAGQTALDIAIEEGLNDVVVSLIAKNAPSSDKQKLVLKSIIGELNLDTIKKVVALGADVNYVDEEGSSVLETALMFDANNDVVQYLLEKGVSTQVKVDGMSPVEFAESTENIELAQLLSKYYE